VLKVAEHSFQEPMPNSPLLLSYLYFGARFLQEFIFSFTMATALVKNKAKTMVFD